MTSTSANQVRSGWPTSAQWEGVGRRLAVATAAGALSGLIVGGFGGRLAMMLLARLAPETAGVVSDDGFVIGQLTFAGTYTLVTIATGLGVVGGGIYVVLRGLMIGPRWFQVLSISLGAAVVVGAELVHTDGVDFTFLHPRLLAIALFVTIPGLYAALLTIVCERWLHPDGRFLRARRRTALAPLILWLPLAPLPLAGVLAWSVVEVLRGRATARAVVEHPSVPWLARLALTVTFAVFLTDLVRDVAVLT